MFNCFYPNTLFYSEAKSERPILRSAMSGIEAITGALMEHISCRTPGYLSRYEWEFIFTRIDKTIKKYSRQGTIPALELCKELAVFRALVGQCFYMADEEEIFSASGFFWKTVYILFDNPYTRLKEENNYQLTPPCAGATKSLGISLLCHFKMMSEQDSSLRHGLISNAIKSLKPCVGCGVFQNKTQNAGAAVITGIIYQSQNNGRTYPIPYPNATTVNELKSCSRKTILNGLKEKVVVVQLTMPRETRDANGHLIVDNGVPVLERSTAERDVVVIHVPVYDHWFGNGVIPKPEDIIPLFSFLQGEQNTGAAIAFQCSGGKSRSLAFAVTYSIFVLQITLLQAANLLKEHRPVAIGGRCEGLIKAKELLGKNPAQAAFMVAFYLYMLVNDDERMNMFISLPTCGAEGENREEHFKLFNSVLNDQAFKVLEPGYSAFLTTTYAQFHSKYGDAVQRLSRVPVGAQSAPTAADLAAACAAASGLPDTATTTTTCTTVSSPCTPPEAP
jgi:hypothetical protein